jgi:gliding motility-associated-like protein
LYADKQGNIYVPEYQNRVIRKINPSGIITHIAGTGEEGYSGDGGQATLAKIGNPHSICMDEQGNLYFSDAIGHVIRKITPDGIISTIAGIYGEMTYSGDGGPAKEATLSVPSGMCMDKQGNILIAEYGNQIIRKINKAGIISTVAGTPFQAGFTGNGGPAVDALLFSPTGVCVDREGNIYIVDLGNNVIRKVGTDGIIRHFAGEGPPRYSGDGGPAIQAGINYPYQVYADDTSGIYIPDMSNEVLRYVNHQGIITTIAGNGTKGFSGDGGNPLLAQLNWPVGMCIDPGGNIYISDRENFRIRKISVCQLPVISNQPVGAIICAGQSAAFSVEETGGNQYRWERNTGTGWQPLDDIAPFSGTVTNTLQIAAANASHNQHQFRCRVTNDCGFVVSQTVVLTVTGTEPLSVSVQAAADTICAGAAALFTATLANPGNSPQYTWRKNGQPVGNNAATYTDNNLQPGDTITCAVATVHPCLGAQQAVSNAPGITIKPLKTASVAIQVSGNNICADDLVNFTATPVNGGVQPAYQWRINGLPAGVNTPQFSPNAPANGDRIQCILTSSENCLVQNGVASNEIVMVVYPNLVPTVSVTASNSAVCSGTPVQFTATVVNGGSAPAYQWHKNGLAVGVNAFTYTDALLRNGDVVTCTLTSNATCVQPLQATSAPITMVVYNLPTVALDKNPEICTGGSRLLDAGSFSSYRWQNGSAARTFTVTATGLYHVSVTDGNACTNSDTVAINIVLPRPAAFLPPDTALCSYDAYVVRPNQIFKSYLWSDGNTSPSLTVKAPGVYGLQVTDSKACVGTDSITILPKDCITGFFAPTAFTPNADGLNDTFRPLLYGNVVTYHLTIYNRYGEVVFKSGDYQRGWDGTVKQIKQAGNVYVWHCVYKLEGGEEKLEKGTVVLVR